MTSQKEGQGLQYFVSRSWKSWKRAFFSNMACYTPSSCLPRNTSHPPTTHQLQQQHPGACSTAWVGLPGAALTPSSSSSSRTSRAASGLSSPNPRPATAAPCVMLVSPRLLPPSSSPAAAAAYYGRRQEHRRAVQLSSSPSPPWLAGRRATRPRGRGEGGFQLGAVTAVRSPGDGAAVTARVEEEAELRRAFEDATGEDGLLGLDGFRVRVVFFLRALLWQL